MERPSYDEAITRQNDRYAMDIIERFSGRQKTAATLMGALTQAFIVGAGGYEGSFDAAMTLEYGGMAVLLTSLGLSDMDKNLSADVDVSTFESAVRAAVDFGAAWDDVEAEIPTGTISDADITGESPFNGPLTRRFLIPLDGTERPDWRVD